jgi:uncharacterized protein YodC (DUF2158 family)
MHDREQHAMAYNGFLAVGDVVRLKSRPERLMTIRALVGEDGLVECVWHDEQGWHFEVVGREGLEFVRSGMAPPS